MRLLALILVAVSLLSASDEQLLALVLKAQADFDRVDLTAVPKLADTSACVLSQAALLPVSSAVELPVVRFRKGYCTLVGASIGRNASLYAEAAAEFQKAIDAWPARVALQSKKIPAESVSSALPVLAAIARMMASPGNAAVMTGAQQQISSALSTPSCPSSVMPVQTCQADLRLGREWLGWIAFTNDRLAEAAQYLSAFPDSGWSVWVAGRQAYQVGNYREAASLYRKALDTWQRSPEGRFAPQPDMGLALTDLGGAQILAGDTAGAIATLDQAVRTDSDHARTFYYRARAKELAGREDTAIADYNLAARTAFASTVDLASGEAHLYRGIAAYRRKDFARAEDEFSNALNFTIPAGLRADAVAWRHLSAVAAGNCDTSRDLLARDLSSVTPFFPKSDAASAMSACPTASGAK